MVCMDYKEKFTMYVGENRLEDARVFLEQFRTYALEESFYFSNMGWLLNHMERYMEAEVILRKGLLHYPHDGWMFSQLGFAMNRLGNIEEGLRILETALFMKFDEPWIHGEIGWCYKELKDYKKAIHNFENGLLDEPNNTWLLSQAAYTYVEIEDMDTAEAYLLKCFQLQPDMDTLKDIIHFYKTKKEFHNVLEYAADERFLQEDWVEYEIGNANFELQSHEVAISHFHKAIDLGYDDTRIRTQLGDSYGILDKQEEMLQQYQIALEYYEKALGKEKERNWIYQEMVWIAHKMNDNEKKLEYLERATKEYKDDIWFIYHFARTYSDLSLHEKAVEACRSCFAHGDQSKKMFDLIAWNLGRCHQEEEAIEKLTTCIETYGIDDWNYGELGWNYARLSNYDMATMYYLKAQAMNKDKIGYVSMLAWCYVRKGEYEKALDYVLQSLTPDNDDGWLQAVAGEVYAGLGEYTTAMNYFVNAIDYGYEEGWVQEEIDKLKKLDKFLEVGENNE